MNGAWGIGGSLPGANLTIVNRVFLSDVMSRVYPKLAFGQAFFVSRELQCRDAKRLGM